MNMDCSNILTFTVQFTDPIMLFNHSICQIFLHAHLHSHWNSAWPIPPIYSSRNKVTSGLYELNRKVLTESFK